jgi:hypothetical protein
MDDDEDCPDCGEMAWSGVAPDYKLIECAHCGYREPAPVVPALANRSTP